MLNKIVKSDNSSSSSSQEALIAELELALGKIYQPAGLLLSSKPKRELESSDYSACRFALNNRKIVFRLAKTTPNKIGQFATIWKRPIAKGPIAPLDSSDDFDLIVISVSNKTNFGQFIFNKNILLERDYISINSKGGKRAIRIYPPWDKPIAKQAIKSQEWQLPYFLPIYINQNNDLKQVRKLFLN